jgi:hypothetical protein
VSFFSQVPLVVSFYTKGTPYEEEVNPLEESCRQFGIEYHIEGVETRGSWEENCAYKPYFMREMMKKFARPLLWVDADAVFLKPLSFEEWMFADLAFVKFKEDDDIRFCVASGTVYVNATEGGVKSLDIWCQYSSSIRKEKGEAAPFMDQVSLYLVLLSKPAIEIAQLPLIYCKIFDRENSGVDPNNSVIEQRQASRRFKTLI